MDILGIDIAKRKFDVALQREERIIATGQFNNDGQGFLKLQKWLRRRKAEQVHACLEATGRYGDELALFLHEQGHEVSIVNPSRIKAYAESKLQRTKTDQVDAKLIADFCATQRPGAWEPPSEAQQELQALVRHIERLKEERTRAKNRRQSRVPSAVVLEAIDEHITFLDAQIEKLEQRIRDLVDDDPDLRRQVELLISIPGISETTATRFIAEVDVNRFSKANQVAAYAGLTPRKHESGSSVHRRGHLSKVGNRRLRAAFYMPALAAMRSNPIIMNLVQRLEERGKSKMTIVGAVMRKLIHLAFGVLKTRRPFDPNFINNPVST